MANRNPPFICETETIQKCSLSDAEFQIRSQFSELHSRLNELQQELLRELDQLIGDRTCKNSEVEANLRVLELALEGIETTFAGNILNSEYSETKHSILNKIHQLKQYRVPDIESILLIWDSEFERCLGKICAISQILPPQGEQRELIHRIAKSREPELGQIWFVVSARWFKEWRSEVNFDNSIFRNMFSSQTSPKRIPIDYSNITKGSTLKYGLKKNRHFILLHSDAWELLLGWHGMENGSVPIPRKTYFDNVNNRVQVDLWECSARESPERNRRSVPPAAPPAPPVPSKGAYYIEDSWRPPGWNCDIKVHVRERDNVSVHSAKCSVLMSSLIVVGTGLFLGAIILRTALRGIQRTGPIGPTLNGVFSSYYRGGFEKNMTHREAARILGISPSATSQSIHEAHRRLMLKNHPDKGGSPFIASKINDAKKMLLEKGE